MKKLYTALLIGAMAIQANAQHLFDYSDLSSGKFNQKSVYGIRSMQDGEHYTVQNGTAIDKYSYRTGEKIATVLDASDFSQLRRFDSYEFSSDESKILLATNRKNIYRRSFTAKWWIFDTSTGQIAPLSEEGGEQCVTFSADGNKVAFVKNNDLFYADLSNEPFKITRLTTDGEAGKIINGHTDWVYEEEYGFTRAFEWSADGSRIAYMRFDETNVPQTSITMFTGSLYPPVMTFKYPKAGEPNSVVTVHVASLDGTTTRINTGPEQDQYISRIGWAPSGNLFFYRSNRLQNHFEVLFADAEGRSWVIYEERDAKYIERPDEQTITFLPKGDRFIVKNETSGFMHLYVYNIAKGAVTDTLTRGNWEVTRLLGTDGDRAYYISNENSPLRRALYSVKLNGKNKVRLTPDEGVLSAIPSRSYRYFITFFSNSTTPNLVRLHDNSGKVLRVLEDNVLLRLRLTGTKIPRKEFFTFRTERGTVLNGYMVKPGDFDPSKKYPVLLSQYSGPGSQEVLDRWTLDWTDVMVQEGYIVVSVDGRGTGGRGAEFRKVTYGNLGGPETEDQISAAKYIATQPYVDSERIGIYGWSYGGFMALNCILKGPDIFSTAVAVAPVTSWRFYDTIYTEIYNGLPQDNPKGYDENSPVNFAAALKGNLLIIHGSADDNVHPQNSFVMADALVRAGKQFDMMIYPDDNHSMVPTGRHHIMERMISYLVRNL